MKLFNLAIFTLHLSLTIAFAPRPAYQLFTQRGKTTDYDKLLKGAAEADVVLFGELHNNPICHWLQLQLTKDLYALKKDKLVLGAEMFETDNQTALTDYVQGRTTDKEFAKQARLWPNYETDYRPVVEFARTNKVPFVAANVPRRYASLVSRQGLAALDTVANKQWLAPLPITVDLTLPGYAGMVEMMGGHGSVNFVRAQALKDATMAHSITQNWQPGKLLLHLNGDYHSKNFEGISWYLHQKNPALRILTISTVEQEDVRKLVETNRNLANFVLAIPADMTKTY
ncbi:MAG: iron-regulated protein [Cytophagales bacterium]|nr:MAG: iron-regulated protein [Cytophagales bacterium]